MNATPEILTGKTEAHVDPFEGGVSIHHGMKAAFILLREQAKTVGIQLQIASGYRSFEAQLNIWNQKCLGKRDVLDARGQRIDISKLSDEELVFAILRWSALPGASRHHWGTDVDVFDARALEGGYKLQLVPAEAAPGGPFAHLDTWLAKHMATQGFFRPYAKDLGGVSPEWWHLSYRPIAEEYDKELTLSVVRVTLEKAEMEKREVVLANLPQIFERFIHNISIA